MLVFDLHIDCTAGTQVNGAGEKNVFISSSQQFAFVVYKQPAGILGPQGLRRPAYLQ